MDEVVAGAGRAVVFRPGALGDALLAWPALSALRRRWPEAHLTLIARDDVLPLAVASGLVAEAYPFDLPAWSGLWHEEPGADPLFRRVVGGADLVVAWLRDPDGAVARNLGAVASLPASESSPPTPLHGGGERGQRPPGARVIVAPGQPPDAGEGAAASAHVAAYLSRTLAPLGIGEAPATPAALARLTPAIQTTAEARRRADQLWEALALPVTRVVALHPGSGSAAKRWPPSAYAALAQRLRAAAYAPLLLEGPADGGPVADVIASAGPATLPVARGLSVAELAALLIRCHAYVGNDSGVSHLAALVGVPTLALFGPTDPARWSPVGRHVEVLRAPERSTARPLAPPTMADLDVGRVWAALAGMLAPGE